MTVGVLSAARTLCELRDWTVSNLELQKVLYISQMIHLGRQGESLLFEAFEAWDYGPVVPELYRHVRGFGSGPVRNIFHWIDPVPANTSEFSSLKEALAITRGFSASKLVAITHWPQGAWSKFYRPNGRSVAIPNDAILEEFRDRERYR